MGEFVKSYGEKNRLVTGSGGKVTLYIGNDDWPFPIPIVRAGKNWRFDTLPRKRRDPRTGLSGERAQCHTGLPAIADAQPRLLR